MKKLLTSAFSITPFQFFTFLMLGCLKYWIYKTGYVARLELPLVYVSAIAVVVLLIAFGAESIIESKGYTIKSWLSVQPKSTIRRFLSGFIHWGHIIPIAFGYLLLLYMFAPITIGQCVALLSGVVFLNVFRFYSKKKNADAGASS